VRINKIIITGLVLCSILVLLYKYNTRDIPRSLTEAELSKYLVEQAIDPIAVKIEHDRNLVLSQNCLLSLSANNNNKNINSLRGSLELNSSTEPVHVSLHSFGNARKHETVAIVTINDKELMKTAHRVRVIINTKKGLSAGFGSMENKDTCIATFDLKEISDSTLNRVVLYDKQGKEIYNKRL
jgi:hypothetical protein